jgi:hypothetical protein
MGWLYRNEPIDDPLAYLKAKYNYDCETHTLQTLDGARVRNTVYLAVRSTDKKTGHSFVFAAVIMISNTKKSGFGYKDMSESMGPCQCDCPDRIMRLLPPLADVPSPGYTADWRARVAAQKTARRERRQQLAVLQYSGGWALRIGAVVTLPTPARFRGGSAASSFRLAYFCRRTPIFEALDRPGFHCRLRAATLAVATITAPPNAEPNPQAA